MNNSQRISVYTPSNTEPEILEQIFVQRHRLLDKSVAWCEESITTAKKNHLLFVGSRGCGKTHFITMLVNRLKNKPELQEQMVIVWLGEDDVITTLLDFILSILEAMVKTYPQQFNRDCLTQAKGLKPGDVTDIILHSISDQIGKRTILLIKENMSDVFRGLKDEGQKKLRAFLQEKNNMAMLTTSQQLFTGVSSRNAPFFGFFDIHHLKPLTVEDAMQFIRKMAKLNTNKKLLSFLQTPQGCYRVRALHYLAGGNHRLYVELFGFLTMESLDNLVSALTQLADELTPYFQERIKSLPPQQGRIVQKLCEMQGAAPVKTIADEMFIGERSVAKQLGDLARKNYVIGHKRGKQTFYEMAEPLMRLSLEVKHNHGKPLKMVVSLLRAWFSDTELKGDGQGITDNLLSSYKEAAFAMDKEILVTINNKIAKEILVGIEKNDYLAIIRAASEIISAPQSDGIPLKQKAWAHNNRGVAYGKQGETELEIADYNAVIKMQDAPAELRAIALFNRGIAYGEQGETSLKIKDYSMVIKMQGVPAEQKAKALYNRGVTYEEQGETELSIKDCSAVIKMTSIPDYIRNRASFAISTQYFYILELDKAHEALQNAFTTGEKKAEYYSSYVFYTLKAIAALGSSFWQKEIVWLLQLFDRYNSLDHLGSALMRSAKIFIDEDSLLSSLKKWQQLWQKEGEGYEEMQLPLQALIAARLAIEQKSDKPLFELPKEIRDLISPLLSGVIK